MYVLVGLEHKDYAVKPEGPPIKKISLLELKDKIETTFSGEECDALIVSPGGPWADPRAEKLKNRISSFISEVSVKVRPDSKAISVISMAQKQPREENWASVGLVKKEEPYTYLDRWISSWGTILFYNGLQM